MKKTLLLSLMATIILASCQKNVNSDRLSAADSSGIWAPTLVDYQFSPSATDPAIADNGQKHYSSVLAGMDTMKTLVVFLPGTYRSPVEYKAIINKAASMGYHVIGLSYPNSVAGNPVCKNTGDVTCHSRLRREIVDGIDRSTAVSVNTTNCILNRLQKALSYLAVQYPKNGWGQYCVNGTFYWNKIIMGGHSQGAQISGVMGKFYP
ncbi:MAG: hypothetical protein J7497_01395, partial [Chitinophagaceae bacterium]|nr:hypothetical protein [Chitinophagaceae bacterium]